MSAGMQELSAYYERLDIKAGLRDSEQNLRPSSVALSLMLGFAFAYALTIAPSILSIHTNPVEIAERHSVNNHLAIP